ncbi:MAG: patatin-like phospholipase family protein [Neisseria sp.]|nr:patatin-like phospholipase family protein [Neisseria sp.]
MRLLGLIASTLYLTACGSVLFQPIRTIDAVDPQHGYRLENAVQKRQQESDEMLMVMAFSGGGTRAAALGYGVLETMSQQTVYVNQRQTPLTEEVDLAFGISGGSVLAAYYALHGSDTVPAFEKAFLSKNLQKQLIDQVFSMSNWPRLTSPEFGRGDLLQEEFNRSLFHHATFADVLERRKGPFAVIGATDMNTGERIDFTQEYFDMLCLDVTDVEVARAVASSSAVPLVFAPVTFNNHGGTCAHQAPQGQAAVDTQAAGRFSRKTRQELARQVASYADRTARPYIHLLDGGLTDNLGLRAILDAADLYSRERFYDRFTNDTTDKIVLVNINAQNRPTSVIDLSANIPKISDVVRALINIPIDRNSQETLRQFRKFVDDWQQNPPTNRDGKPIKLYFISLNLSDVRDDALREQVLNIPTSFYLPPWEIGSLKRAARDLLYHSAEYRRLLRDLSSPPVAETTESAP